MSETDRTRELQPGEPARTGSGPPTRRLERPGGSPPAAGEIVLDRYRLERPIGRGGHGVVWEAVDERLERPVAVKAIRRTEGGLGERAEREGRVAARLNHPGIVGLYELGSDDQAVYLVSELVRGRTMAELSAAGGLSDRDVCHIGLALCSALDHAHDQGVIHRDVKPQNVIVVAEPAAGAGFAKLTDFGVARVAGEEALTRTGAVVGTLAYMAPEQAEGSPATPAADVYSLALVLYEGWTGSGPDGVVAGRLAGRPVVPLRRLRRDLPPRLCQAIDTALDPRPGVRPALDRLEAELRAADELLSDEGGLVEPATRRRLGIPSAAAFGPVRRAPAWLGRVGAGVAAGALLAASLELLVGAPPVPPLAGGAAAAAAVAALPRIGWLAAALAVLALLAAPSVDERGTALVLAAALAPVPLLLPRAGLAWSLPALAPLLGAIGLAPLFVVVAGLASTAWRRAGLAITGFLWLAGAELITGEALLFGSADGVAPAAAWGGSALDAARDAIYPTLASPALAPAAAWAALAVLLGLVLRGRSLPIDLLGVVLWALALVVAHEWLGRLLAGSVAVPAPEGVAAAAVLGAATALAVSAAGLRPGRLERPYVP